MEKLERINKYLSESGVCSRREVDELIESGRVEVNGLPARIGMQIDTERDEVRVDGEKVNPNNPLGNAISEDALLAQQHRPWWQEHNEYAAARDEAKMANPKSKLLRKNGKKQGKALKSTKTLAQLRAEAARAKAIKTRGHSAEDKQAKNELVQATEKELRIKQEKRDENRRAKSLSEVMGTLKNPAHTLKERRVEGVNPKSAQLRGASGKKNGGRKAPQWHGSMRRTRNK